MKGKTMYSHPKTRDEWWANVDKYWEELYDILSTFGVTEHEGRGCEYLKETQNRDLARCFNEAWWRTPDNPSIHAVPSWRVLCDLCSEEYVLYEEEEQGWVRND